MSQNRAIVDKLLTGVSQKIMQVGMIAEQILTPVTAVQYSGKIGKYGNEHLRIVSTISGGRKEHARVETSTRDGDTYHLETHGLSDVVTKEDYANVEKPFDAELDSTDLLSSQLMIGKEKSLADTLSDTTVITENVTLSGTSRWNDYTNSNPIEDINTAKENVRSKTGQYPNTLIIGATVLTVLKYHPAILDKLGFKNNRAGSLSIDELARALDVKRILVGEAVYNAAKKGQPDDIRDIWGKVAILCLTAKTASKRQKTLGYRVTKSGQKPRQVFKNNISNPPGAKEIIVEDIYDQVLTDTNAAYLIKDAIA